MSFCANPECPHRKRTGKPAEFVEGITHCSDCGNKLSQENSDIQQPQSFKLSEFHTRLILILGILALYRILTHIPIPGIDYTSPNALYARQLLELFSGTSPNLSVMALGLAPFISSYILTEVISLFLPRFKKWRKAGRAGRAKLFRIALLGSLILAIVQGYFMAKRLEGIQGGLLVWNAGLGNRILITCTVTAGAFIAFWMSQMITKKGIGHGISVIIASNFLGREIFNSVNDIYRASKEYTESSIFELILYSGVIALILIVLILFVEKATKMIPIRLHDGTTANLPLKLTTAGVIPGDWAAAIIMIPATFASFSSSQVIQSLAHALAPDSLIYNSILLIMIIFFYYLFTAFFYNSDKIIELLGNNNASLIAPNDYNAERYIDKSLEFMAFIGAIYLTFLLVIPTLLIVLFNNPTYLGGISMIISIVVLMDIWEDIRNRKSSGQLVKIEELHDIPKAGLLKSILETKGIPCYLRGYYHRALLYFFGPYIEVSVLVPADKVDDANEAIRKYMNEEYH